MKMTTAVARLAALAQETRLAAFRQLVQAGPGGLCVTDLAARIRVPLPTLSFHLKALTQAGLVVARQEGRFVYFAPRYPAMMQLVDFLTDQCCGGADCGVAREGGRLEATA